MNNRQMCWYGFVAVVLVTFMWAGKGNAFTGESSVSVLNEHRSPLVGVKGGVLVGGGDAFPGVEAQLVGKLNSTVPIYAGGELGMYLGSGAGSSVAIIPILGTIYTHFQASRRVHATLGLSAGPTLATGGGYSTARFALLLNPGVNVALGAMDLTMQLRFGAVGSSFVVLPQLGLLFMI